MKNLKFLRTMHHLSQSELSHILHVSQQSICKYESGHSEAGEALLIKTADFFGTSIDYLLGRSSLSSNTSDNISLHNTYTLEEISHLSLYKIISKEQKKAINILLKGCITSSSNN